MFINCEHTIFVNIRQEKKFDPLDPGSGQWREGCNPQINPAGGGANRAGVQSEKGPRGSLLGGSLSCYRSREREASGAVYGIPRYQYGTRRSGPASIGVVVLRFYKARFGAEKGDIELENTYFWGISSE